MWLKYSDIPVSGLGVAVGGKGKCLWGASVDAARLLVFAVLLCGWQSDVVLGAARTEGFAGGTPHIRHLMQESRIVGGGNTAEGRFTYMCSLKNNDRRHVCGAVLIDARWALTAAHCVHPEIPDAATFNALLAIGAHKRTDDDGAPGVELIKVAKIYRHESYSVNEEVKGSDIALLELATPSSLTPIPLPNSDHLPSERVLALGWGRDSRILQQLLLDVKSEEECRSSYPDLGSHIVCAGNDSGDTCKGDSGGPILIPDSPDGSISAGKSSFDALIGLTSFGNSDCAAFTKPAGYTFVAPYLGWIEGIMQSRKPKLNPRAPIFKLIVGDLDTCQSVLVHPQWVATPALCLRGGNSAEVQGLESSSERMTGTVFIHPQYTKVGVNDIALVKLSKQQDDIVPLKLPKRTSQPLQGQELTSLIYEWKKEKLFSVRMEYLERDECAVYGEIESTICAGAFNSLLCLQGTAGAPLLHEQGNSSPVIVGLLIAGPRCTTASSVVSISYQGLSSVVDWIQQTIDNN